MRAVANKGIKGNFRGLSCVGAKPALSAADLQSMLREGLSLNVNVVSGDAVEGYVNMLWLCWILGRYCSILLFSYSISSGALGIPDLLLSYSMITLALHNTLILMKTHLSDQPLNQ